MNGKRTLEAAGWLSAAVAVLHVVIVFVGPAAYRYFGAGEDMARQAEAGSFVPAALTLFLVALFAVFALYAFSGAGGLRRLPLLRTGLITIGLIYTLRGLALIPELIQYLRPPEDVLPRELVFSLVSLVTGLLYLLGTFERGPVCHCVILWRRGNDDGDDPFFEAAAYPLCRRGLRTAGTERPRSRTGSSKEAQDARDPLVQ